ncbi:MAG TPA: cytidylate kinase-like family protein [Gemmatimonadaceae bacterium]|nr:cytidylate kinase-like family protein [Gemmatimonadaceae bacterium]
MPVVTVSRLFGSGGGEVAHRVADALGWTLLDNAMVDAVAERLGVPVTEVSEREERVPSVVERVTRALTLATPQWTPAVADDRQPDESDIIEVTRRVIDEAVQHGPCVVVGRGAQCVLAERGDALHVLCHAPRPALVRRVAARLGVTDAEAERQVLETNRQREHYVRRHWQREWLSARNYHLCLDTEWLGIDGAAHVIVELARKRLAIGG